MFSKIVTGGAVLALTAGSLLADFSYQETSKITGGALASMMRIAGVFSKQAREPIQSNVAVKGDRMVHRTASRATVIDLGSQTITTIDLEKKTYSVMTFDEMKQTLAQFQQRKQGDTEMHYKVSAANTGNTKQVAGFEAKELVLKMEAEVTDSKSGQTGAMNITSDMWIAPAVEGYGEVRDFQKRMAEKLAWTPGGNMFQSNPQVSGGMAEVSREIGKLDGMPVMSTVTMGGAGAPPSGDAAQPAAAQPQAQAQPQPQAQPDRPSLGGALGGALGSRLGLGRKKQTQDSQTQQPSQQGQAPAGNAQGGPAPASGALLEMTTEMSGFSSAAVAESLFAVPAGFKKVEPDMRRRAR